MALASGGKKMKKITFFLWEKEKKAGGAMG